MRKIIQNQAIDYSIYVVRGHRIMLDEDLAKLYGVQTRVLNQAIHRNKSRFPEDFMFQLTTDEYANLMSQIVTSSWGGRRKRPFAFTEHGTVMLASVLRSKRAIEMNIEVIKAFIRLRRITSSQVDIASQLSEIRQFMLKRFNQVDKEFMKVWKAVDDLTSTDDDEMKDAIGFKVD